jgi:hypothetical protein
MTSAAANLSSTHIVEEKAQYSPRDNPLPRAVIRQNFFELLDGEWRFDLDPADAGIADGWHLRHDYPRTAVWPGSIEAHMASAREQKQEAPRWQDKVIAWYEREFDLPSRD